MEIPILFLGFFLAPGQSVPLSSLHGEASERNEGTRLDNFDERGPYFGGDMVLSESQLKALKSGIIGDAYRWPYGKVPYVLDSEFESHERSRIMSGMNMIQNATCIRFHLRTTETSYVYIKRGAVGTGCFAFVGRHPTRPNIVNLQYNGCIHRGIVAHELLHALGFYHEQSRPDRDDYIYVIWSNIRPGAEYNFYKLSNDVVSTYDVPYDYDSLMHYSAYAFAVDRYKPTVMPTNSSVPLNRLGQRKRLSQYDADKINAMYKGICEY